MNAKLFYRIKDMISTKIIVNQTILLTSDFPNILISPSSTILDI